MGIDSNILAPNPEHVNRGVLLKVNWYARRAPTGRFYSHYGFTVVGANVSFWFGIAADWKGSRVRGLSFALPSDVPRPATDQIDRPHDLFSGQVIFSKSPTIQSGWPRKYRSGQVMLREEKTGNIWLHALSDKPIAATHVWGLVHFHM